MKKISLLAVVVFSLAACSSGGEVVQGGTEQTTKPSAEPNSGLNFDQPFVLMDGWSVASAGTDLSYTSTDGREKNTKLAPLTNEQVQELVNLYPAEAERILTYTVTVSNDLVCEGGKCETGEYGSLSVSKEIDLSLVNAPENIEGIGAMYAGNNITSLMWAAQEADMDTVGAGLRVGTPPLVVGSAFTQIFELWPTWLYTGGNEFQVHNDKLAANPDVAQTFETVDNGSYTAEGTEYTVTNDPYPAYNGLGSQWDGAERLNYSQLTALTAPTWGCSSSVLCVPGQITGADENIETSVEQVTVCATADVGGGVQAAALVTTVTGTMDVPTPTYQWGVSGSTTNSYGFPTAAELVEGETPWNTKILSLLDPDFGTPYATISTDQMGGNTHGEENLAYTTNELLAELSTDLAWSVCS